MTVRSVTLVYSAPDSTMTRKTVPRRLVVPVAVVARLTCQMRYASRARNAGAERHETLLLKLYMTGHNAPVADALVARVMEYRAVTHVVVVPRATRWLGFTTLLMKL